MTMAFTTLCVIHNSVLTFWWISTRSLCGVIGAHDQPTTLLLTLIHLYGSLAPPRSTQSRHTGLNLSVTLVSQQEPPIEW
jgi:hypothetical protein